MQPLRSPQRFARGAQPSLELLALSYWRAARAAEHPCEEIASQGVLQLVRLASHPRLRPLIDGKTRTLLQEKTAP